MYNISRRLNIKIFEILIKEIKISNNKTEDPFRPICQGYVRVLSATKYQIKITSPLNKPKRAKVILGALKKP